MNPVGIGPVYIQENKLVFIESALILAYSNDRKFVGTTFILWFLWYFVEHNMQLKLISLS